MEKTQGPRVSNGRAVERWTADEAQRVLEEQVASGLSIFAYAALHKLNSARLYRWRAALNPKRESGKANLRVSGFISAGTFGLSCPVQEKDDTPQVVLKGAGGGAVVIQAPEKLSPIWLATVLRDFLKDAT